MARNRKRPRDRRARRPGDSAVATAGPQAGDGAPDPIAHATPDTELAEAQLALGRPELAEAAGEEELEAAEATTEPAGGGRGAEVVSAPGAGVAQPRESIGTRLTNFLRGSWRELQRVQWPDRRQVMQATGVVIGFVIVAGVFLGVADVVAQKIVNLILYGHT